MLTNITRDGYTTKLLNAGARRLENACGFCIGNAMSPGTDAVSLRTKNRNFEGRSGTKSAQVYLVSPETAAVAALTVVFVPLGHNQSAAPSTTLASHVAAPEGHADPSNASNDDPFASLALALEDDPLDLSLADDAFGIGGDAFDEVAYDALGEVGSGLSALLLGLPELDE